MTHEPIQDFEAVAVDHERSTSAGGSGGSADELTSLSGRQDVLRCLRDARHSHPSERVAVFYIDVDHFKRINDRVGHAGGDAVLLAVANRLRAAVRPGDIVSRFGGDEFVVVAAGVADSHAASVISERIRAGICQPIRADGRTTSVTVSIGIAIGEPAAGQALLDRADSALYRAKELGRDRMELFEVGDRVRSSRRMRARTVLTDSLDAGRLSIAYQPVVDLETGSPAMMRVSFGAGDTTEDLLRLAEESGLIVSLGAGLLDGACAAASGWPSGDDGAPAIGLVWGMTARQLEEPHCCDQVLSILEGRSFPSDGLTVEVAETCLSHAGPAARRTLERLHAGGIRLMIGSFGKGAGAIAAFREFPVDAVTLDDSFIEDLVDDNRQMRMVTAVLAFARLLGIDVAVQGVASEAQMTLLRALGCRWASGPYFGEPNPEPALLRRFV